MSSSNNLAGLSLKQIHQMIFIYNAVMNGWCVKRVDTTGNFRFKKRLRDQSERKVYQQDGFLQRFVQNMQKLEVARSESGPNIITTHTAQVEEFELPSDHDMMI